MQLKNTDALKKWCKDEESFQKVKQVVEDLIDARNQIGRNLELLESAIRTDYDSIIITELTLEKPGPKIVYVNDGFCKMTGYDKEEVIGKTPRILQGPKTDRAVLDKLKKRLREGQSFFGQAINYRKDGSEFVNQWDIHPLTDEDGNITHWVSYQHDISKRKRAEQQLVDQKVEFDDLREESQRTVVDVDLHGNIVMANKSFRELIGYGKDDLKQIKIWDLFPEKYKNSLKSRFEKDDEDAQFGDGEFEGIITHKTGNPVQVKGETEILDLKDQKLIRAEIENISLKKRIMSTLEKRNHDYSKMVQKASEFSYKIMSKDGNLVFETLSEEFPEITGLSIKDVEDKADAEKFIHEDDLNKFWAHLDEIQNGKESTCAYRLRDNVGNYVEVLDYGRPVWDEDQQNVIGLRCAVSVDDAYEKAKA